MSQPQASLAFVIPVVLSGFALMAAESEMAACFNGGAAKAQQDRVEFVRNHRQSCLDVKTEPEVPLLELIQAEYAWLAKEHPGYRFKEQQKPMPQYLKKLGCATGRGDIIVVETSAKEEVTVCFCWPKDTQQGPEER